MLAKTIAFALSFAIPLLLVRRLSLLEIGLYKQIFLFIDSAMLILPLGVPLSAYYFLPRETERRGQVVFNLLLFSLTVGGAASAALLLRPSWLAEILNNPELTGYVPLAGLIVLLWSIAALLEVIAMGNQEVRLATFLIVAAQLTKALFFLAATVAFTSVRMLLYAAVVQGALQVGVLLVYLRLRFGSFWRNFEWSVMRAQLSYALPLGVAAVIFGLQWYLDNYFVSYRFGTNAYAIYSFGCFQLPLLSVLTDAVASVLIPRVSLLQKNNERCEIIAVTANMMRKLSAIYFPLYVFLLVAGREFIILLFTEKFVNSWPIFAVNITLIPLGILASACDPVMRAYAEHRYFLLKARLVLLCLLFAALWYGTLHFGMVAAITIAVGVNVIERLVVGYKVKRILGVTWRDLVLVKDMGKLALAAIAGGVATFLTRTSVSGAKPLVMLVVCALVFSVVYLAAILLLRILTSHEQEALRRIAGRVPGFRVWETKSVEQ